jgi:hypothetical protein
MPEKTLEELEEIYMNGFADEVTGDVDWIGHFYRVGSYIVQTDQQGFRSVHTHSTEDEAVRAFKDINIDYTSWDNE